MGQAMPPARQVMLVVEDEPPQRMMAVDLVEDAGFEAVDAMRSSDTVRLLEAWPDIRIVFTDIDMPGGLDRMKLAALIRDRWPPIELIISSARGAAGRRICRRGECSPRSPTRRKRSRP